jgi:hypothetical protein
MIARIGGMTVTPINAGSDKPRMNSSEILDHLAPEEEKKVNPATKKYAKAKSGIHGLCFCLHTKDFLRAVDLSLVKFQMLISDPIRFHNPSDVHIIASMFIYS